ncbi:MAG: zinc-binding dehydrogenase [Saprospiraceae bacterium]
MKAYVLDSLHQWPVLSEVPMPKADANQVALKIKASALNHRDLWITKGQYAGIKLGVIMGSDACGVLDDSEYIIYPGLDWGDLESHQSPQFRVLGMPDDGTFAEYIAIDSRYLFPKPIHLSSEQAAALPLAGLTAYRALFSKADVKASDKVLITGIGGGVALMALQMSLALGCVTFVTSGSDLKIAEAISLGATAGYSYLDSDWHHKIIADSKGIDVVIDGACGTGFDNLVKVCSPGGRIVFYGATAGKIEGLNPQTIFWKQISILGTTMGSAQDFGAMVDFVATHQVYPVVDRIFPFEELHEGFARMESGLQFGKIVFRH